MVSDYGQRCCENAGLSFIVEQALRILRIFAARMCGIALLFTFAAAHAACPPSAIASLEKPGMGVRNGVDRGVLWRIERDGR
ncbi:MAG: hypothetical protein ACN6RL_07205, partial [Variovorax sp.]